MARQHGPQGMNKYRSGNFFEDFRLGMRIAHPTPRTVTLADQSLYIGLTGSRAALSSASTVARRLGLHERPLEDLLVFHIAFGKTVPDISQNGVANLGYARVRFMQPVFAGDTLQVSSEVVGLRQNASGRSGVVYVHSSAANQHGGIVLDWVRWVMVHKRDAAAPAPPTHVPALPAAVAVPELAAGGWSAHAADIASATQVADLWEDYAPGERIEHPGGMTVNESDHSIATRLYQNTARAHFDAQMMAAQPHARRLVYGGHVISLCKSLSYDGLENVMTWVAINGGQHVAPTFAGDTLHCATEVLELIDLGLPHIGALRLRTIGVKNQPGPAAIEFAEGREHSPGTVLDIDYTVLMPRRLANA